MVKNTEKSTSGCWPRNVSDSEDSSPEECLHTQSVFLQKSQGQEGGSERAVHKQIMKTRLMDNSKKTFQSLILYCVTLIHPVAINLHYF